MMGVIKCWAILGAFYKIINLSGRMDFHPQIDHWNAQVLTDLMWSDKKLRKLDSVRVCKNNILPGK